MIDNQLRLNAFLERLRAAPWIAIDTEADSLHAYPEKVCLIQISIPDSDDLIDPLAGLDLAHLFEILGAHELILHGADYDLRLLRKHHDFVPGAVFDTMLASRLLGITQFGLTNLVAQFLGVTLEKGSQKADWARRPLTEKMEAYARNDTRYLRPLSDRLRADLVARGRLEWHQQCCARLIADSSQLPVPDENLVWRVKGSNRLSRPALAILREIWRWRESEAIAANKPPFFVLNHEAMPEIAARAAAGQPVAPLIPQRFSDRRRAGVLHAVERGLAIPPAAQPGPVRHTFRRISDATKHRLAELQKRRDARATELGLDPTLIASRATLLDLAENWEKHQLDLMPWQRQLMQ